MTTTPPTVTRRLSILTILGTRPELVKLAPFIPLADADPQLQQRVLHTGQHYSVDMDAVFFEELALRPPDVTLQVGSQSHAAQTAAILVGVEAALLSHPPDVVVVLGDTNSTLGGALAAAKLGIPIVHIEAGCRSFLRTMPEEINRVVTDHCASLLLCPNAQAQAQLQAEGIAGDSIVVVGSTSIDAARSMQARAQGRPIVEQVGSALGLGGSDDVKGYGGFSARFVLPERLAFASGVRTNRGQFVSVFSGIAGLRRNRRHGGESVATMAKNPWSGGVTKIRGL